MSAVNVGWIWLAESIANTNNKNLYKNYFTFTRLKNYNNQTEQHVRKSIAKYLLE